MSLGDAPDAALTVAAPQPAPGQLGGWARSQRAFQAALAGLLAVGLLPVWLLPVPALQDYPQHLFNVAVLLQRDGATGLAQHYQANWQIGPYTSVYALLALLAYPLGLMAAGKAVLSLIVLANAAVALVANRWLCRLPGAEQGPRWLLLLLIPLTFTQCWYLGLLNYCLAVPLALVALVQQAQAMAGRPSAGQVARHAAVVVALALSHPFACLAYGGLAGLAALWRRADAGQRAWGLGSSGAALVLAGVLSVAGGLPVAGPAASQAAGLLWQPSSLQVSALFLALPALGMGGADGLDALALAAWLAVAATVAGARWRRARPLPGRHWRERDGWALLAATMLAFLALPQAAPSLQFYYLNLRLALLVYGLAVLLAARQALGASGAAVVALAALVLTGQAALKQAAVSSEISEILPIVRRLPAQARVLPLVFDPTTPHLQPQLFHPHIHAPFYQPILQQAGFTPHVFATSVNPVRLKPGSERPAPPPYQPQRFEPAKHWSDYDFLLVRRPPRQLVERLRGNGEYLTRSGAWALWRRVAP